MVDEHRSVMSLEAGDAFRLSCLGDHVHRLPDPHLHGRRLQFLIDLYDK